MESVGLDIYKYPNAEKSIEDESQEVYYAEGFTINDGVYLNIIGMEYPSRSVAPVMDLWSKNIAKRFFVIFTRVLFLLPRLPFRPIQTLDKILYEFNDLCIKVMRPYLWKDNLLTPVAQEIKTLTTAFLINLGISPRTSLDFGEIFANLINIDDAYRFRVMDIFNESSKEQLQNPRKELKRLAKIYRERESCNGVYDKFHNIYRIMSVALLIPKVKQSFIKAINVVEYKYLRPDDIDHFWMCIKKYNTYKYFGKTETERRQMVNHLKVAKPSRKPC